MGWQQRSRRRLPPGVICYLCGLAIEADQDWNKDHVPPQRFFGKAIRVAHNPNLNGFHTHTACNSGYKVCGSSCIPDSMCCVSDDCPDDAANHRSGVCSAGGPIPLEGEAHVRVTNFSCARAGSSQHFERRDRGVWCAAVAHAKFSRRRHVRRGAEGVDLELRRDGSEQAVQQVIA